MLASQPITQTDSTLSPERLARFSRQLVLPGFDQEVQLRLARAKVLVIGAGGLGSATIPYLASSGVGTIGVADTDQVELSNLHRQVSHGVDDLGRAKLDSIADSVARIDPQVNVVKHPIRLDSFNILELLDDYNLVVDGSDNFPTRYLSSDATALRKMPLVWGAILQYAGQVGVSWAGQGPTYRDLFPVPPAPGDIPNCAEGGVLPGVCAVIGGLMATEVVKIVTGIGDPLLGRVTTFDALTGRFRELKYQADPTTPPVTNLIDYEAFCGVQMTNSEDTAATANASGANEPLPMELNALELAELLGSDREIQVIDIREPFERDICGIEGSDFIPLGSLEERLAEVRTDIPVVLYCHHGSRSARALSALRNIGYENVGHLSGGIDAFAAQVDRTMQRY